MKLYKKNLLSALTFALIIAVSVIIHVLLTLEKEPFDKMIIQCVVFSELLSFLNVLVYNTVSSQKKLSLAAGGYSSSVVYVVLTVAISILFSIYYRNAEKTYIILLTVITAVFIVASILIYIIGKSTASNAAKVEKSSATFKKLEYLIESICSENENPAYSATFVKVLEAIKSCDQSSYVDTDDEIYQCLEQLKVQICTNSQRETKIEASCEKIFALIKQRTAEVSGLKLGGV